MSYDNDEFIKNLQNKTDSMEYQIEELEKTIAMLQATIDAQDGTIASLTETIGILEPDSNRYKFILKNVEWRRYGHESSPDKHSFIGIRFPYEADFSFRGSVSEAIDRLLRGEKLEKMTLAKAKPAERKVNCRGSWAVGTACGKCQACADTYHLYHGKKNQKPGK